MSTATARKPRARTVAGLSLEVAQLREDLANALKVAQALPAPVADDELVRAQARRNALRTFLQGLAIDVGIAVALLVTQLLAAPLDAWQGWAAIGIALGRTILGAVASYVMRRFVDGRVATPLNLDQPPAAPIELEDGGDTPERD